MLTASCSTLVTVQWSLAVVPRATVRLPGIVEDELRVAGRAKSTWGFTWLRENRGIEDREVRWINIVRNKFMD